jgi:hypothetical protein
MQQPKPEILVCSSSSPQPWYISTPFNLSNGDNDEFVSKIDDANLGRYSSECKREYLRVGDSQTNRSDCQVNYSVLVRDRIFASSADVHLARRLHLLNVGFSPTAEASN